MLSKLLQSFRNFLLTTVFQTSRSILEDVLRNQAFLSANSQQPSRSKQLRSWIRFYRWRLAYRVYLYFGCVRLFTLSFVSHAGADPRAHSVYSSVDPLFGVLINAYAHSAWFDTRRYEDG